MSLLQVRNLTVFVRTHRGTAAVVRDLNLDLEPGQTLGIIGESGSGKSLAMLAVMGLLPSNAWAEGSIQLEGQELLGAPEKTLCSVRGNRIGMVFQEPMTALDPVQRVVDQVAESLRWHQDLPRSAARAQAVTLLERVGIPHAAERAYDYPHQFSGGQRQRIMIASALACQPALLIADEPTTALDVTVQAQILQLLQDLVRERKMAMLLISHDLAMIARNVQRMLVMYAGSVVEQGATQEVVQHMAHPYARALLAARPRLGQPRGTPLVTIPGQLPSPFEPLQGCRFAPRCAHAQDDCRAQAPVLHPLSPTHSVACWHEVTTP